MTEMVHGTPPIQVGEAVLSRWWRTVDRWTIFAVILLFAIGLLLALAASPPLAARHNVSPFHYFERQLVFGIAALAVMLVVSMLSPALVRRWAVLGWIVAMLVVMALPVIGTSHGMGAVRWLSLRGLSVQPSEFLKPMLAVTCAWLLAAAAEPNGPPGRILSLGVAAFAVAFLVIQPDFGQSVLVLFAWGVMYFVSGAPMLVIFLLAGIVALGGMAAYATSSHFAGRINRFLEADVDERSQVGYALSAIQEGGLFGVGVGEGQVKWTLPEAHTDYIVAVAAEEYGFALVAVIIGLYATICLRALSRLARERDPFCRIAGTGLVALMTAQAMINLGVAARLLPAKGMTLPFVSYGGSSLIAMGLLVGMLLALTRSRPQGEIGTILRSRGR
jgi:cell division protein FtsW